MLTPIVPSVHSVFLFSKRVLPFRKLKILKRLFAAFTAELQKEICQRASIRAECRHGDRQDVLVSGKVEQHCMHQRPVFVVEARATFNVEQLVETRCGDRIVLSEINRPPCRCELVQHGLHRQRHAWQPPKRRPQRLVPRTHFLQRRTKLIDTQLSFQQQHELRHKRSAIIRGQLPEPSLLWRQPKTLNYVLHESYGLRRDENGSAIATAISRGATNGSRPCATSMLSSMRMSPVCQSNATCSARYTS